MKKKNSLLALLLSVAMFASIAVGCEEKIDASVPDTTVTTTTEATTTTAKETTTTEATTTEETTTEATTKISTTTAAAKIKPETKATTTTAATTTAATTKATVAATTAATTAAVQTPTTSSVGRYVYNYCLNAEEKTIYDELVAAITARKDTCTFSAAHKGTTVMKVLKIVYYQEATLFWLTVPNVSYTDAMISSIPLSYLYTASQQTTMQANLDASIAAIKAKFPANASTVVKLKIMHDYIITKTTYAHDVAYCTDAYGPLVAGVGQCESYAKATSYACTKLGIESVRVMGHNSSNDTHAWNKVLIDGAWYNVDLTWDDPKNKSGNFVMDNFFLVPDAQINGLTHFADTSLYTPPVANSLNANYFVQYGLYITSADKAVPMIQSQMIAAAKAKTQVTEIKCSTKEVYDAAHAAVLSKALAMKDAVNATAGCNKVAGIEDGSSANTLLIRINLVY